MAPPPVRLILSPLHRLTTGRLDAPAGSSSRGRVQDRLARPGRAALRTLIAPGGPAPLGPAPDLVRPCRLREGARRGARLASPRRRGTLPLSLGYCFSCGSFDPTRREELQRLQTALPHPRERLY